MHENSLECFLYQSQLADGADSACIAHIVEKARTFNWTAGITGMLVFDGKCFFQYVEGPPEQLTLLVESIAKDPRHINFTPLFPQARIAQRRFSNWSLAHVVVNDTQQVFDVAQRDSSAGAFMMQGLLQQTMH